MTDDIAKIPTDSKLYQPVCTAINIFILHQFNTKPS